MPFWLFPFEMFPVWEEASLTLLGVHNNHKLADLSGSQANVLVQPLSHIIKAKYNKGSA